MYFSLMFEDSILVLACQAQSTKPHQGALCRFNRCALFAILKPKNRKTEAASRDGGVSFSKPIAPAQQKLQRRAEVGRDIAAAGAGAWRTRHGSHPRPAAPAAAPVHHPIALKPFARRMRTHIYPQQWLLCHRGLYWLELKLKI